MLEDISDDPNNITHNTYEPIAVKLSNLNSQWTSKEPDSSHLIKIIVSTLEKSELKRIYQDSNADKKIREVVKYKTVFSLNFL